MKKLLLGNEAVARGLFEAGCKVVSSYPGTPSTEITEYAAEYDEIYAEWAPNEKVAAEVAIGAAFGGVRSFCGMKHVGLNVAADPVFTASYIGVNAGLCIAVADDPGMHSSQNEQDSRHYAIAAKLPMLEPSDAQECKDFTKLAFELSERYDTPVFLRLSTRISHSRSLTEINERKELDLKPYEKDVQKYVMMPGMARKRHVFVEERTNKLIEYAEQCEINKVIKGSSKIGIIVSGCSYVYAREALGDNASYLKLGMVNPLPVKLIEDFAKSVDTLYVVEELDPIIEQHCKANGINVIGKELFPILGEFSQAMIKEKILNIKDESKALDEQLPVRPPVMCCGCPHRGLFYTLKRLKVFVSGDIGCYTLASQPPIAMIDTVVCMGASVSGLHGFNLARGETQKSVAVIGDSTFIHSGITGLIDIAYNKTDSKVIILDNSITGMTGHQQNPTTGLTLKNEPTQSVNLEELVKAVGIKNVVVVDPYNLTECYDLIKAELAKEGPSVIISRRPCALLKSVKAKPAFYIDKEKCKKCGACMQIGCPAISKSEDGVFCVDQNQCVGCGQCSHMCKFDAIKEGGANC